MAPTWAVPGLFTLTQIILTAFSLCIHPGFPRQSRAGLNLGWRMDLSATAAWGLVVTATAPFTD